MNLSSKSLSVGIWSEDYEKLADWYENVLDFKVKERSTLENDTYVDFDFGENYFFIGKHDQVKGENRDKYRIMIGFDVKSVLEEYEKLLKNNVKIIASPFPLPTGGPTHCCTFEDPEGNILQIYGNK